MSTTPTDSTVPPRSADAADGHLRRVLGTPSLVLFGLVYMVPLTVFTTYGIVTQVSGGRLSVARANLLVIAVQAVFIAVFVVLAGITLSGAGSVDPMATLRGDGTADGFGPILAGAAILALSFLGFDAVSTLSEEAKDPTRSVPRAIKIATVASGIIFVVLSHISQLVVPSNEFTDVDSGSRS